ncbi:MAG TPA: 1,4-dihydroxy-2-naphthoate octaprenyltransferase, partial [Acidimicrobiia bacterium]|nr:1,4-dihydroxy-2-naphthoate octaprenyltransferase [Acidimicrobiia bacterium]
PNLMWRATWSAISVAAVCGLGLAILAGPLVLLIGVASVAALLGYVGGPVPYGYKGLGEVFVFVFFGLVATAGSRFVHDRTVDTATWWLAVPVGLMAVAILVVNNLRDLETDERAGKRTLAVIVGDAATRRVFTWVIVASYGWVLVGASLGILSWWSLLCLLSLPLALRLATTVRHEQQRRSLGPALGQTARLHLVMGLLLATGTLIGARL